MTRRYRAVGIWQRCALMLPVAVTIAYPATPPPESAAAFRTREAASIALRAQTPEDFANTARAYRDLLAAGNTDATVYYNLGTALLLAGEYDQARRALEAAERLGGTNWEIQRNLSIAGLGRHTEPYRHWHRVVFFWHFYLPGHLRMTLASVGSILLWVGLLPAGIEVRPRRRIWVAIGAVLFIGFGASAFTSLIRHSDSQSLLSFEAHAHHGEDS